jgi:uncharacterized membrane protein
MAKDMSDTVRDALSHAVREAIKTAEKPVKQGGALAGARGLAAGAGLAAAAPLAKKGVDALRSNGGPPKPARAVGKAASKAGDKVASGVKDGVTGGVKNALPGGDDSEGGNDGMPGVGKKRRMPVQQAVDVAVPLETAYNQWTQFEDWPEFMHRVTRVTQEDDCTVSFATKIWGKTKEFEAQIETQRPEQRIKWRVSQGITHAGVVTFHELAPSLTRIEVNLDIEPDSLIEKAARGMRHVKRAVRADLARFKAFIEMQEIETGAWRGVIEDGEVVEPHDDSYDDERDYSDVDDLYDDGDEDADEDEDDDSQSSRTRRFKRQAEQSRGRSRTAATSKSSSSRSTSKSGSGSRSKSGSSRSGSSKSGSSKSTAKSGSSRSGSSKSSSSGNGSSRSKSSSSKSGSSRSRGSTNGKSSARGKSSSSGSSSSRRRSGSRS